MTRKNRKIKSLRKNNLKTDHHGRNIQENPPEDVFITVFKRKPTEEELWMGVPPDFDGNRPSGNNLIDLFAYLIRKYGRMDTSEYARIMQLKTSELRGAILAIGGMSAMEWRNRYLLLEAQELMERTDMSITRSPPSWVSRSPRYSPSSSAR